ncbi:efflux RND transporter periplasmic adaptor subunit [Sphingomonas sp. BK069]|uniref:efflux RND transporter periplasmic adaptor subunit n=1 Tax=Sphingomonas sp. BK069 TaxID=2586979 RepID=UPI0016153A08|nr:efflux RND transporter periplasmic adaptor subunit [Sphingomonas sp. BK069]MBB3349873.1 RND family efflux transporter MFP subunit [Sphingomonas sp. BK069]
MPNRQLGAALASATLLSVALSACGKKAEDPRTEPPLVRVSTPALANSATREFTGIVAARVQSDLGFRVGGKVIQRLVNAGETVRRGQPLMRIDNTDLALATRSAAGSVEAARARAIQTAADERRYRDLVSAGAVSASAYDQARAAADSARAQLVSAEAQAGVARNEANYTVLLADADGTVVETLAEPGQVVAAGQIVVRIARSGPREALVQLPETLRPALGTRAQGRIFDGATGTARLRQLSDSADPASRTFEARYVLEGQTARAPLGSTVTIALQSPGKVASTEVPLGALRDIGRGPGVWIVRDGKQPTVAWQPVKLSAIGEETATIVSGLTPGQRLVAMGAHMLHQGEAVRIAAPAPGAAR